MSGSAPHIATPEPWWVESFKKIRRVLTDRENEAEAMALNGRAFERSVDSDIEEVIKLGNASGPLIAVGILSREALERLVGLGHDLELLIKEEVALRRAGICLDRLFDPLEFGTQLGLRLRVEQSAVAVISRTNGPDCHAVMPGHIVITVPIKISMGVQTYDVNLNTSIGLMNPPGDRRSYFRVQTRGMHFCPSATSLERAQENLILEKIKPQLAKIEGRVPVQGLFSLPFGQPSFYAGRLFEIFSMPATLSKRPRHYVPPLSSLPDWADSGMKIVPHVMIKYIDRQISSYGARRDGNVRFVNSEAFDVTALREEEHKRKVLCVNYTIRIKIWIDLRIHFSTIDHPGRDSRLQTKIRAIGSRSEIGISPEILEWLFQFFLDMAESFIATFSRNIDETITHRLSGARRATINVNKDRIAIYTKTRELP